MSERFTHVVLPSILFTLTVLIALTLGGAVVLTPWLIPQEGRIPTLLQLYAQDATVRRTSFASALGLLVTAFVFFKPASWLKGKKKDQPPQAVAGA